MSDLQDNQTQRLDMNPATHEKTKDRRPWFKKKRFILPLAVVLIGGIAVGVNGQGSSNLAPASVESTSDSLESPSETNDAPAAEDWYKASYPTFTATKFSGKGDDVQNLPNDATSGIIVATHKGGSNFVIELIDDENSLVDLAVNEIGNYTGTTAFGLSSFMGEPKKLQIKADGAWTIRVVPFDDAPPLPKSGKGDGVFKYESSKASTWTINHKGKSNFSVSEYADSVIMGLLVNEIGNYSGKVPASAGPAIIVVTADGTWTIE